MASLCISGLGYYWFFVRSAARPSPLFVNARQILEMQQLVAEEPRNPEWLLGLADLYRRDGHNLSAVDALKRALALGAPEVEVRRRLYRCYRELDQYHLALSEAARVRELSPTSLSAHLSLADAYMEVDRRTDARRVLQSVPVDDHGRPLLNPEAPDTREARWKDRMSRKQTAGVQDLEVLEDDPAVEREALAVALARVGDWKRCLEISREAIRARPQWFGCYVTAGQSLVALGRAAEAVPYFKPAAEDGEFRYQAAVCLMARSRPGDRERAEKELEAAVRLNPTLGRAWWELARIQAGRGKWLAAADAYTRASRFGVEPSQALRLAADAAAKAGNREAREQLLGAYFQISGRPAEALALYRKRLREKPDDEIRYRQVAGALGALKKTDERLEVLLAGLKRFPRSVSLTLAAAKTYSELQRNDDVIRLLRRAVDEWAGDSLEVSSMLASTYNSIGRVEEAEAIYRKLLPQTTPIIGVRFTLAELLLERRDDPKKLAEAIRLLEECVTVDRTHATSHRLLGTAYSYARRDQEAVWALRHAVDLSPGEGLPYQLLGDVLTRMGNQEEASWMQSMAKQYRDYARTQEKLHVRARRPAATPDEMRALAEFYARGQSYLQAEKEYRRLLERYPRDRQARLRLADIYGLLGRGADQQEMLTSAGTRP